MVLISRISRLLQADLHAVLDRLEEPDSLLRQAVRDMEDLLARDEERSRLLLQEQRQIHSRLDKVQTKLHEIGEELDICFQSNKEELAKKLIRRQLESQQFCNFLADKRNTLDASIGELKTRLKQNHARLDSMRQKAELFNAEDQGEYAEDNRSISDSRVADEDVDVAFLRESQKRSRL
jgi:phage shock protein A